MGGANGLGRGWTFVSNHLLVLRCIAEDPNIRMADVARRVRITERAVQGIVSDLERAGYLRRSKVGRRNHYEIDATMPMRHLETQHRQLGELLAVLDHHRQEVAPGEPVHLDLTGAPNGGSPHPP
jgi:DNA-binding IclR family transcriptional regulator